jgi:uncharacterized membrane-anchored protein
MEYSVWTGLGFGTVYTSLAFLALIVALVALLSIGRPQRDVVEDEA